MKSEKENEKMNPNEMGVAIGVCLSQKKTLQK